MFQQRFQQAVSFITAIILTAISPLSSVAEEGDFADSILNIAHNAAAYKDNYSNAPDWASRVDAEKLAPYQKFSNRVLDQATRSAKTTLHPPDKWKEMNGKGQKVILFITLGNDFNVDDTLDFLSAYTDKLNISVALSGLPEGCKGFACAAQTLQHFNAVKKQQSPEITLDPSSFKKFHIVTVPTMILLDQGKEVARVEGIINPQWLIQHQSDGVVDLGKRGPTVKIAETNLLDEIKARIAKVDWDKKKRTAISRYWKKHKYVHIPSATEPAEHSFMPMVRASSDIKDIDGNILVAKGTTVNMLDKKSFTRSIIIFNGKKPNEVAEAKLRVRDALNRRKVPVLIATELPDSSFKGISSLEKRIGYPVYLLDEQMRARFDIRHTMSIIEATAKSFVVTEVPLGRDVTIAKTNTLSE